MANENIINVKMRVNDDGTLQMLGGQAEKTSKKLDKTGKSAHSADRQLKGAAQASSNTTKNFSKMSQGISGGLVPAYATLAAQLFALDALFRFLREAADFRVLQEGQEAFAGVTGRAMKTLAKDIQTATAAQVTFKEASQAAAIGLAAGLSPSQLNELGEAANVVSVALGRDTTDSFNRLIRGVTNAETKKNTDEDDDVTETTTKVTSTQTIIVVSIVLGAILALIRASVVLANANAGPDVTSALVLTTPVLTFFFSAMFRIEHFSFREVNREHPENVMKVLAILSVSVSVAVVCSYRGALMFGDPKEYEAPNVLVGAIWMLTNTLASSVAIVMQKMIINANIPIEIVNAAMTGIGAFWLLIVGFIAHGTSKDVWTLSSDGLYAVLFGAFFPSAMNLIIFAKSSKILGPNITARYFLLQPAMTWVLDYVVLKDAVYESYVICAFFSAMAMMLFASANSFVRKPKEEEREQQV